MDQGTIAEQGSHEELLALKGKYYQLWEMQQGNFKIAEEEENIDIETPELEDMAGVMSYT